MANYYCEKCGTEVPAHMDHCPNCGLVFDAVRCPECKYTGNSREFKNGCPVCGYLAKPTKATDSKKLPSEFPEYRTPHQGPPFYLLFSGILLVLIISILIYLFL